MGWVQKTRDHGGVLFVDLRDHTGLLQVVFHPGNLSTQVLERARAVRGEFVLAVQGMVAPRPDEMVNPGLPTGEIELEAKDCRVLNVSLTPPFAVDDESDVGEDLR